ncbi:MAG: FAD-dependent oxidoreductase [Clostridia bacterium]|nr:FAD-dependent oxidoreductase [Clostridia bacterium]
MKKEISRRNFIKGMAAGALGASVVGVTGVIPALADEQGIYTPGTYSTSATGMGEVTVTMTFDANSITEVIVNTANETPGIGQNLGEAFAQQILEAQSAQIDAVSGATVTSNAVATAAAACIAQAQGSTVEIVAAPAAMKGYCSSESWLGDKPAVDESQISATVTADIVVVGGGHAGIQVALAAAQQGATVAVIEKQNEENYTVLGEDTGIWNSRFMQETFGLEPYDVGEVVHEFVKRSAGRVNPDLIHAYVSRSGEMFDNAVEIVKEYGEDYILDPSVLVCQKQMGVEHYPIECGGWKTWATTAQFMGEISHEVIQGIAARSMLPIFSKALIRKSVELGAAWHYGHSAVVLCQDDGGAVTGCIAQDSDGNYVKFEASKGVAVTTGDFSTNSDMCWALLNEEMEWADRAGTEKSSFITPMARDGYGHKMVCWAGGIMEPTPRPTMNMGGGPGGPWGTAPFMWLNKNGKRYCNEASIQSVRGNSMRQPAGLIVAVTDKKWMQSVCAAGIEHGGPNYGRPVYYEEMEEDMGKVLGTGAEGFSVRGCTVAERNPSVVYGAETLDELADYLGYEGEAKQVFLDSIARYNEMCYAGADTDYGKDANCMIPVDEAPFYGVKGNNNPNGSVGLVTLAGVNADSNMNVLDMQGNPIKGLYVAGNTLGGRYGTGYCTPCAGNSIGMAQTHGYVLGEYLAKL